MPVLLKGIFGRVPDVPLLSVFPCLSSVSLTKIGQMWVGREPPRHLGSRWKPRGNGEWPCSVVRQGERGRTPNALVGREDAGMPLGAGTPETYLKTGEFPRQECICWQSGWLRRWPEQRPQDGELGGAGCLEGWVWGPCCGSTV